MALKAGHPRRQGPQVNLQKKITDEQDYLRS
jgi:hypothetical protein